MPPALLAVLAALASLFQSRSALHAEVLSLRHQLLVLNRQRADKRVPLRTSDRILWSWLSRIWTGWRHSLVIVQPETVIRWHRQGFRLYWRNRPSRSTSPESRSLPRKDGERSCNSVLFYPKAPVSGFSKLLIFCFADMSLT